MLFRSSDLRGVGDIEFDRLDLAAAGCDEILNAGSIARRSINLAGAGSDQRLHDGSAHTTIRAGNERHTVLDFHLVSLSYRFLLVIAEVQPAYATVSGETGVQENRRCQNPVEKEAFLEEAIAVALGRTFLLIPESCDPIDHTA